MELWDGYFKDGSAAGITLIRGNPIPKGIYHMVCEVIVRHADGDYLVMKRDLSKQTYAGYYEATAGGSALKGENKLECAIRELYEETGIVAEKLEQLGRFVDENKRAIYFVFFCETDCDKSSVRLQRGETCGYTWVNAGELTSLIEAGEIVQGNAKRLFEFFAREGVTR